jgi:hypothetical protein
MTDKDIATVASSIAKSYYFAKPSTDPLTLNAIVQRELKKFLAKKSPKTKVFLALDSKGTVCLASSPVKVIVSLDAGKRYRLKACTAAVTATTQDLYEAVADHLAEHVQQGRVSVSALNKLLEL